MNAPIETSVTSTNVSANARPEGSHPRYGIGGVMTFRALLLTTVVALFPLALVTGSGPTVEAQEARGKAALMNPAELTEQAPAAFTVNFETSAGANGVTWSF